MRAMRRIGLVVFVTLCLVVISAGGYLFFRVPAAGPFICPACFGFESFQDRIYLEQGASAEQRNDVASSVHAARSEVSGFFGSITADPAIFVCVTENCYRRADAGGGESRGISWVDKSVLISPRRMGSVILTHELTHAEFLHRLGVRMSQVPAWFNEGLAAYISNDPRYVGQPRTVKPCVVELTSVPLPVSEREWVQAPDITAVYAEAACRVGRWLIGHGNSSLAVLNLVAKVRAGTAFDEAFAQ